MILSKEREAKKMIDLLIRLYEITERVDILSLEDKDYINIYEDLDITDEDINKTRAEIIKYIVSNYDIGETNINELYGQALIDFVKPIIKI